MNQTRAINATVLAGVQLDGGGPEDGAAQRDAAAARRADLDEADRRAAVAVAAALTHVFADWGEDDIATLVRLLRRLADNALSRAVPKRPRGRILAKTPSFTRHESRSILTCGVLWASA
jgi:hypothetical protein